MSTAKNCKALIVVDVQREYVAADRPFCIAGIGPSLVQCSAVLKLARESGWPIAHIQHLQDSSSLFATGSEEARLIRGFEPRSGENLITKSDFSCYSAPEFEEFVAAHRNHELVIIGYGATMCVLSTIIDGYHRGDKYLLVTDATAAKAAAGLSEASLHQHAVAILGPFAKQTTTSELIAEARVK